MQKNKMPENRKYKKQHDEQEAVGVNLWKMPVGFAYA